MEAKTMGSFIAALRKANGMTQKDLAEKLNVSDKSVSRWERDDGTPDLSLIPVIAEVFGITCDELLRGERKPEALRLEPDGEDIHTPKGERQRQRILKAGLAKYRSRTLIAAGIACTGLIAAMICNFGFMRASLGFFIALFFYLAAAVCEAVFLNNAFFAVSDEEEGEDVKQFKKEALSLFCMALTLIALLFVITLPLVTLLDEAFWGLTAASWLEEAVKYLLIAAALIAVSRFIRDGYRALKKGDPTAPAAKNWRLKGIIAGICALVMLLTVAVSAVFWDTNRLAMVHGETFGDFESFRAIMETEKAPVHHDALYSAAEVIQYDESGEPVTQPTESSYPLDVVRIDDGTPEGKVLGYFQWKNHTVQSYSVDYEDMENIRYIVVTDAIWQKVKTLQQTGWLICAALCLMEAAAAVLIYKKLKTR